MIELATAAEETLAQLFSAAHAHVRYEPKIFRVHGRKKMGFRPDFHLAEIDLYVEVGNLVNKRKKMRMMRGHYPEVKVLFLDNKEVRLFQRVEAGELLRTLTEFHARTHQRGLTLTERERIFEDVAGRGKA